MGLVLGKRDRLVVAIEMGMAVVISPKAKSLALLGSFRLGVAHIEEAQKYLPRL